jgi:DNA helicase-2/ATP-dependent DNA helicase PcrA
VGDDDQAIYRFRGADASCITGFERRFPDAQVVTLEESYRSTPQILAAANRLIAHNRSRREKTLRTARPGGPEVSVRWFAGAREEARAVALELAGQAAWRTDPAGAAVLYRSRLVRPELEAALSAAGIPYLVLGGLGLYERAVVRDALAYLRVAANPRDREAFIRAAGVPRRGVGAAAVAALLAEAERSGQTLVECALRADAIPQVAAPARTALCRLGAQLSELAALAPAASPSRLVEAALLLPGGLVEHLRARGADDARAASDLELLRELVAAAREYERRVPEARVWGFLEQAQLAAGEDAGQESGAGRVTLATIHAAKGAEWALVWVCGLEAGTLPSHHATDPEAIEEERRLLYVALTRARERLVVSGAARRAGRARARSPFLSELSEPARAAAA